MRNKVYEMPLSQWICTGLHKESLEEAIKAINDGRPIENKQIFGSSNMQYINKVLREEVVKQFSDSKRPFLEVVLNSIDAKPEGAKDYAISLSLSPKKFVSKDDGKGMSLESILKLLIIPFSTEKNGVDEIGRFGVGFLSSFNYCISEPNESSIMVDTRTGTEAYEVTFYSKNTEVDGLMMRIKKNSKPNPTGTTVTIRTRFNSYFLRSYLFDHLKGVPSYIANVSMNGKNINDDSEQKWYSAPVNLHAKGKQVTQQVGIRIGTMSSAGVTLTSQGVRVKRFYDIYGDTTVSFPPAVQIVEGRDDFKMDDNFKKSVASVFKAFEHYLSDQKIDDDFRYRMINLTTSLMSAFSFTNLKDVPNIDNLVKLMVGEKKYVLQEKEFICLSGFMGQTLRENAFETSMQAYSYWREMFKTMDDLYNEMLPVVGELTTAEFDKDKPLGADISRNIHLLRSVAEDYDKIKLVSLEKPGKSSVYIHFDEKKPVLYINMNHPDVKGDFDPLKAYSVMSDYWSLPLAKLVHGINADEVEEKVWSLAKTVNLDVKK